MFHWDLIENVQHIGQTGPKIDIEMSYALVKHNCKDIDTIKSDQKSSFEMNRSRHRQRKNQRFYELPDVQLMKIKKWMYKPPIQSSKTQLAALTVFFSQIKEKEYVESYFIPFCYLVSKTFKDSIDRNIIDIKLLINNSRYDYLLFKKTSPILKLSKFFFPTINHHQINLDLIQSRLLEALSLANQLGCTSMQLISVDSKIGNLRNILTWLSLNTDYLIDQRILNSFNKDDQLCSLFDREKLIEKGIQQSIPEILHCGLKIIAPVAKTIEISIIRNVQDCFYQWMIFSKSSLLPLEIITYILHLHNLFFCNMFEGTHNSVNDLMDMFKDRMITTDRHDVPALISNNRHHLVSKNGVRDDIINLLTISKIQNSMILPEIKNIILQYYILLVQKWINLRNYNPKESSYLNFLSQQFYTCLFYQKPQDQMLSYCLSIVDAEYTTHITKCYITTGNIVAEIEIEGYIYQMIIRKEDANTPITIKNRAKSACYGAGMVMIPPIPITVTGSVHFKRGIMF